MDMFMDKLAQKLTAQEIIKANTSADTEELNRLRSYIAEYNDCLVKLHQLIEDAAARLQSTQVSGEGIDRLVEESFSKIKALQQDTAALEQLQKNLTDRLDEADRKQGEHLSSVNKTLDEKLDNVNRVLDEKLGDVNKTLDEKLGGAVNTTLDEKLGGVVNKALDEKLGGVVNKALDEKLGGVDKALDEKLGGVNKALDERLDGVDRTLEERQEKMAKLLADSFGRMDKSLQEKLAQIDQQLTDESEGQLTEQLEERFGVSDENVHKECVKVYRNVQAVVVEESGKQTEALNETKNQVNSMGGKLGSIRGIAVAALVFSLLSTVLQILGLLSIL